MKQSPRREGQKTFCYTHFLNPSSELHPEFVRFDYNAGSMDFDYGSHRHSDHELIYVEEGQYRTRLNGRKLTLRADDLLLVSPGDLHRDEVRPGLKYYSLSFNVCPVRDSDSAGSIRLLNRLSSETDQVFHDKEQVILELFHEAAATMESRNVGAPQLAHILLHEAFWRLAGIIPENSYSPEFRSSGTGDDFASRFYRVLSENLSNALGLNELSRKLAMSPALLNRLCNEHLNQSPGQLVLEFRLARSKELLAHSEFSIREISEKLGFKDQFTFSRAFKRNERISPREYRQREVNNFLLHG